MSETRYIAVFEIASSKIKGAVASVDSVTGKMSVIAIEEERANDIVHYGCVRKPADVYSHITSIRRKLEENPKIAPNKIKTALISLSGHTLRSTVKSAEKKFAEETKVTEEIIRDIRREIGEEGVKEKEVVKVLLRDFVVDGTLQQNPVGVFCRTISASMNVLYSNPQLKINLSRVFENQPSDEENVLQVQKYPILPIALASHVLTDEEKKLGCMLVDFGAETTTVSIYKNERLRYLVTLPLGSRNITRDIMILRSCLESTAEDLKKAVGNIDPEQKASNSENEEVNNYIYARASEIVANINEQLSYAGLNAEELPCGIIITGGGAKLVGFNSLLSQQTGMKIRTAEPAADIEICDKTVRPSDQVDIIALLAHAEKLKAKTNMLAVPEEKPADDQNDKSRIGEEEKVPLDEEEEERPEKPRNSTTKSLLEKLKDLLSENDSED